MSDDRKRRAFLEALKALADQMGLDVEATLGTLSHPEQFVDSDELHPPAEVPTFSLAILLAEMQRMEGEIRHLKGTRGAVETVNREYFERVTTARAARFDKRDKNERSRNSRAFDALGMGERQSKYASIALEADRMRRDGARKIWPVLGEKYGVDPETLRQGVKHYKNTRDR